MRRKSRVTLELLSAPQAYVMPDEQDISDADYDAMPEEARAKYLTREVQAMVARFVPDYDTDPVQDAIESEEFRQLFDGMDEDDWLTLGASEIEKAAASVIAEAVQADFEREVSPGAVPPVEIDSRQEALKLLLIAVWGEVSQWKRPPKPEAIAAGVGVAVAQVRGERGVKHPRDIAKEARVRAQTLHRIKNVALQEIQRLSLRFDLSGSEA